MSNKLEDTFGADFADRIEQKIQKRREEREEVSEETKAAISHQIMNEGKFEDGDPMFQYATEEGITHDVLLMKLAEPNEGTVWNQVNQFDNGGFSLPLDYLGEWYWSIFNDESMAKKMDEGVYYIVIGNIDTWEPDEGDPQEQLSPVRGVIDLDEAKEYADKWLDEEGFGGEEGDDLSEFGDDEEEEEEEEDESDAPTTSELFSEDGEEEEEEDGEPELDLSKGDVENVVEDLADQEPEVWEATPDDDAWDDAFRPAVADRLGLDPSGKAADEAMDIAWERIQHEQDSNEEGGEDSQEESLFG